MKRGITALSVCLALSFMACRSAEHTAAEHGHDHGAGGHAHEGEGHGTEAALEPMAVTRFTEKSELFAEFPPLVVGRESKFAAHITRLSDYAPIRQGRMRIRIEGPASQEISADEPRRPGIYGPVLVPKQAGTYRMTVELTGPELTDIIEVGDVTVYATADAIPAEPEAGGPEPVTFLKEQAWRIPFGTAVVAAGELPATVPAYGWLEASPGNVARVSAAVSGLLVPAGDFPLAGQPIRQGQLLARLVPGPGDGQSLADLTREQSQATARLDAARKEQERLTRLQSEQAASTREVDEAKAQVQVLEAELKSALSRLNAAQGAASMGEGVAMLAPIGGRVTAVRVNGYERVRGGEVLFEIAEASSLRLRAEVAEVDLPRLNGVSDAWFILPGEQTPRNLRGMGGQLLSVGSAIDPMTRTVPVLFELPNADGALFAGTAVRLQLLVRASTPGLEPNPAGASTSASSVIVPASAVVDDNGQPIVYVQLEGEAFERREVVVGPQVGDQKQITSGVKPGERVVTRGAYEIRLASLAGAGFGHGHAH